MEPQRSDGSRFHEDKASLGAKDTSQGTTQKDRPLWASPVSKWISPSLFRRELGQLCFQRGEAYDVSKSRLKGQLEVTAKCENLEISEGV